MSRHASTIHHEPAAQRFTTEVEGSTAFIKYRELAGHVLDLDHTYVPPAGRGRGIASQLAAHALRYARDSGYKVLPTCPFIAAYLERHAEFHDLQA